MNFVPQDGIKIVKIMYVITNGTTAKLNGTIWSGDGGFVSTDLIPFFAQGGDLTIELNTPGGSVFDGFVIYNTIKNSGANVTVVINGLVASMGTIIMLAGSRIQMRENSFLMIHAPSTETYGTSKELQNQAKLLESIEAIFVKYYALRTGKSEEDVTALMQGENWFNATEALASNLVDELIDSADDSLIPDLSALYGSNIAACFEAFENMEPHKKQTINTNTMKLNAQALAALDLTADATEAEINSAIVALGSTSSEATNQIADIKAKRVNALIEGALNAKKITAAQKDRFIKIAQSDFELAEETINALPAVGAISASITPSSKTEDSPIKEGWNFSDYVKKDPAALKEIQVNNPEAYAKLLQTRKNK